MRVSLCCTAMPEEPQAGQTGPPCGYPVLRTKDTCPKRVGAGPSLRASPLPADRGPDQGAVHRRLLAMREHHPRSPARQCGGLRVGGRAATRLACRGGRTSLRVRDAAAIVPLLVRGPGPRVRRRGEGNPPPRDRPPGPCRPVVADPVDRPPGRLPRVPRRPHGVPTDPPRPVSGDRRPHRLPRHRRLEQGPLARLPPCRPRRSRPGGPRPAAAPGQPGDGALASAQEVQPRAGHDARATGDDPSQRRLGPQQPARGFPAKPDCPVLTDPLRGLRPGAGTHGARHPPVARRIRCRSAVRPRIDAGARPVAHRGGEPGAVRGGRAGDPPRRGVAGGDAARAAAPRHAPHLAGTAGPRVPAGGTAVTSAGRQRSPGSRRSGPGRCRTAR
jgi:hypothetical protein